MQAVEKLSIFFYILATNLNYCVYQIFSAFFFSATFSVKYAGVFQQSIFVKYTTIYKYRHVPILQGPDGASLPGDAVFSDG